MDAYIIFYFRRKNFHKQKLSWFFCILAVFAKVYDFEIWKAYIHDSSSLWNIMISFIFESFCHFLPLFQQDNQNNWLQTIIFFVERSLFWWSLYQHLIIISPCNIWFRLIHESLFLVKYVASFQLQKFHIIHYYRWFFFEGRQTTFQQATTLVKISNLETFLCAANR